MGSPEPNIDYKELLDNLVDITLITDSSGKFSWVSPQVKEILGYEQEEIIGIDALDFIHEDDHSKALMGLQEVVEKGSYSLEYRVRHKNGHFIPFHGNGRMLINEDELYIIAQIKDITIRRKMERDLKQSNVFIKTILDNLPIGVATNKFDSGMAEYINKKFQEIYGWPEEELRDIAEFFKKVYPDDDYREILQKKVMEDINSGDKTRMHWENLTATAKDGSKRIINAQNIPLIGQNTMVSTVWDVTEQKRIEKELEKEKERAELYLDLLSHDIGNLHQGIASFAQIAKATCCEDCGAKEHIITIEEIAKRSQNLINNVKILSSIKDKKKELEPIDLNRIIDDSITITKKMFTDDNIMINYNSSGDTIFIYGEEIAQNIFVNLLHNGIKAQIGGDVRMDISMMISEDDDFVIITISDHGPGIPEKMRSELFNRRDRSLRKAHTGIGLSLVRELVDRYDGRIIVKDRIEGDHTKGALFEITFPCAKKR